MRFKVGQEVVVKSVQELKNIKGVEFSDGVYRLNGGSFDFTSAMIYFCGLKAVVKSVEQGGYLLSFTMEDGKVINPMFIWQDWMLK
jgi:hypothetical protein